VSTHRSTWKRRERDAAALFGAKRQPLSGSVGGRLSSDSTHESLFIECKLRASSSVRTLWERTRIQARKAGKTPVLVLYDKCRPGALVVVHSDDLAALAAELAAAAPKGGPAHADRTPPKGDGGPEEPSRTP
jgi:hypothetical protein